MNTISNTIRALCNWLYIKSMTLDTFILIIVALLGIFAIACIFGSLISSMGDSKMTIIKAIQ